MDREERDKYEAWAISLLVHIAAFIVVSLAGLFAAFTAESEPPAIDIALYEAADDTLPGGSAGGGAEASAPPVTLPDTDELLPEIAEEYTRNPTRREEYKNEHRYEAEKQSQHPGSQTADGKNITAAHDGMGSGIGKGNGSGAGNGDGEGSGTGTGTGTGDGAGQESRQRPKTPPQFLSGREPRYPYDLQEQGIGGVVALRLTVEADGTVSSVEISASSGYEALDAAAAEAAYSYRFAPALNIYDKPVKCIIGKKIVFNI
ncbi:MAG: TonB family protein [Anaerovibrio sp.]|nr:TonB family protein [Anaerovibrio sp.]